MWQPIETKVEGVNRGCREGSVAGCKATTFNETDRDISSLTTYREMPLADSPLASGHRMVDDGLSKLR
jgi:hypothetical protein